MNRFDEQFDGIEKMNKKAFQFAFVWTVISGIVSLVIVGLIVWAAVHFLGKVW